MFKKDFNYGEDKTSYDWGVGSLRQIIMDNYTGGPKQILDKISEAFQGPFDDLVDYEFFKAGVSDVYKIYCNECKIPYKPLKD